MGVIETHRITTKVAGHETDAASVIVDNLDIWTSAIRNKSSAGRGGGSKRELYGIKKLRELILELAVRGLLVPQDPNDEPASELLKKIAAEKARLVKEGKIKKQKDLTPLRSDDIPFSIPGGWSWARLGEIGHTQTGGTPKKSDSHHYGNYIPFLKPGDILDGKIDSYSNDGLSEEGATSLGRIADSDSVLMVCIGTIGKCARVDRPVSFNQQINSISPYLEIGEYLVKTLQASFFQNKAWDKSSSTTIAILNKGKWEQIAIPLPPQKEQHRIVAKVDELMALCDQLEQQTESSLTAHETLVEALLGALTNAVDHDNFQKAWQHIAQHFDTLFTTEHSIDQLKQPLLQLAVMGKLVPQDPNDEPARELLKKIVAEKAKMAKEGKIKKQKALLPIREEEKPYHLPQGWEWCRLPNIGQLSRGKSKHRPRNDPKLYRAGNIPLVQTGDVARANEIITTYTALYNEIGLAQSQLWPKGTMCITIAANIADTGILGFDACFPDSVVGYTPLDDRINVRYFDFFIKTAKNHLEKFAPSTAQKNINLEILSQLLVPCPPLQEINRIVNKVEELMTLCDTLKACLNQAQTAQLHLADALTQQAIT